MRHINAKGMVMRENDIVFFNVHRRYLNRKIEYGGFLGIYILSAFINKNGYYAQGYSGGLTESKKILDKICQEHKVHMVGLYCDYENVTENIFLSKYIKEHYQLPVIVGGPQATAFDVDFFRKSKCDAVVRYEGEITVLELMDLFLEGIGNIECILGIAFFVKGKLIINRDRPLIQDLDMLPFISDECYLDLDTKYHGLSIMTGRGCPFNCAFCHEGHHTRQVRFRSVENVMEEVDLFLKNVPDKQTPFIMFTDDTFTLQPERVKEICKEMKERRKNKKIYWFCEGHVHTLYKYPEMIKYIAESGAYRIQLGIEAGVQSVLNAYRKNTTVDEIKSVVRLCLEAGLEVFGNIIIAGACYDKDVYEKNLIFAKELLSMGKGRVELGVLSFWPLPNTDMTRHPEQYGLKITDADFITSLGDFPQVETKEFDRWDISEQINRMEQDLKKHMKQMLDNWMIPTETILRWLYFYDKNISSGLWFRYLLDNKVLFSYYSFLYSGEAQSSDCLEVDIIDAHPMRVVEIYNNFRRISEHESSFCDCKLSSIECEILLLSTGKLSVKEMVDCLEDKGVKVDCLNVIEVLKRLEHYHLLVWSNY